MATMYPRAPFGAKSHGEVELFHALQQGLDEDYAVFYSVAWLAPRRPGLEPSDGESDFVILHPDLGLLTLEVKGGQISFDPYDGWFTQPHGAARKESIRDPFLQAKDNKYSLRRKLQTLPGWRNRYIRDGHAVAFPDGVAPAYPPRPDAQPDIVLSALDLPHIARRIEEIYDFWAGEDGHDRFGAFSSGELSRIIDLLGRKWDLRAPRLSEKLAVETERIVHLTEKQYSLLGFLGEQRRASIAGPAGSGKTMIAVE
ncbi:MAG: nuclease-related domain-containing protein, partial [Ktedonobacterales bacterium]